MKKLTLSIITLSLVSCGNFSTKKNMQVRIGKGVKTNSGMPNFYLSEQFVPKKKDVSRSIASVAIDHNLEQVNNKKVYFLTLLGQYNRFNSLLGKTDEDIRVCPFFHNSIVRQGKYLRKLKENASGMKGKNYLRATYSPELLPMFPELSLPVNDEENVYQYTSQFKSNDMIQSFVKVAMEEHAARNKSELKKLCEYGASDNYYLFENLLTHFNTDDSFNNSMDSLRAVLKIPVFANLLLLRSLDPQFIYYGKEQFYEVSNISGKYSIFEEELITRTNLSWMKLYIMNINSNNKEIALRTK